ncbi:MAG TPA: Xaa-Pro peptidase family protein [Candidatus Limnocylindria bacterium]|nr:Xaa-Pro peptidase family protein [Candidatus Limnocylindria bacterium]
MTAGASGFADRLARAQAGLRDRGAAALLIGIGAELRYLTGYATHPLERLTMLVLPAAGGAGLIVPRLEAMAAAASPAAEADLVEVVAWDETDDPYVLVAGRLAAAAGESGVDPTARLLVDPGLPALHLLALQRTLPGRALGLATEVTRALRMVKGTDEIELLRRAAHAADRVIGQVAAGRLLGRTEADVSAEVRERLVAEGHEAASFAIVASGLNSASPHHAASERVIQAGDPIVLDIGGTFDGYGSDITRTLWVTGGDEAAAPTPGFLEVFALVRQAQAAASDAVRPGVACGELDEIARAVIRDGGYGDAFIHRLGHGIGLEAHEEPYLVAGNDEPIELGYAFSIEPGIYLDGRFGVRIEDIVICGADGPDVLNLAPHDLLVVDG